MGLKKKDSRGIRTWVKSTSLPMGSLSACCDQASKCILDSTNSGVSDKLCVVLHVGLVCTLTALQILWDVPEPERVYPWKFAYVLSLVFDNSPVLILCCWFAVTCVLTISSCWVDYFHLRTCLVCYSIAATYEWHFRGNGTALMCTWSFEQNCDILKIFSS